MNRTKQMNASRRTPAKMARTIWLLDPFTLAGLTTVALRAPMEKVNAPCTGCESAEITCHATVYVPRLRFASNCTVICGPLACTGPPSSAWVPSGASTLRLSPLTPAASSKVRVTRVGVSASTVPGAGSEATRVACAKAGVGAARTSSVAVMPTATRDATHRGRFTSPPPSAARPWSNHAQAYSSATPDARRCRHTAQFPLGADKAHSGAGRNIDREQYAGRILRPRLDRHFLKPMGPLNGSDLPAADAYSTPQGKSAL